MADDSRGRGRRTPEESKDLIVKGARQALGDVGIGGLTVATVMDRTPLGRSSFYVYFRDLDELTLHLLEENVALFATPSAIWFEDPTARNLAIALPRILEVWQDNRGWWGELITHAMAPRKGLARQWRTTEVDLWSPMIAALIPPDCPAVVAGGTTEGAARSFVLMLFGVLAERSMDDVVDVEQLGADLTAVALSLFYGADALEDGRDRA